MQQRVTPNTVKEAMARVVVKQASQPNICPEHNNFFHIAPKYQQQRLTIKNQVPTSKSIEEKRYKAHKNNISENHNNRTNSSSKSRVSAFMPIDEDSLYSNNALKLRKIIGDPHMLSSNILHQLSKQNLTSNFTSDSQSPGQRKPTKKQSDLWNIHVSLQQCLLACKRQHPNWNTLRDFLTKYTTLLQQHKQNFLQISELQDVSQQIVNNLFECLQNAAIQALIEQETKFLQMNEILQREKEMWQCNYKQVQQERDVLLETVKQLKQPTKEKNLDNMDTIQLKEMQDIMQQKIQEMSEKEAKLIKLVLAIKRSGVDIEKIYNEEVLNDDSITEKALNSHHKMPPYEKSAHDADNSIVNDSDESSFCFLNRLNDESLVESVRKFEYKHAMDSKSSVKLKLDLSNIQQKQQQQQKQQVNHNKPMHKIKIPEHQENTGFHQEFMKKINEFSESWRVQALKEEKRTKS